MFTATDRQESRCTHQEYYSQFVNAAVKACVLNNIGIKQLLASDDEHLNDISLRDWDRLPIKGIIDQKLYKACHNTTYGEVDRDKFIWSPAQSVCIAKAAARIIIAEHRQAAASEGEPDL